MLSVCLPAYLEEENLRLLLPRLIATLKPLNEPFEILVIDTVTPLDQTAAACSLFADQGVRYIPRQPKNTFGDAVRTAVRHAKGDWLLFMDADGSHTPEFIPQLFERRNQGDVIVASRYISGGFTENPAHLIWMSRVLNWTYSVILGIRCKDISNSFKIYNGPAMRKLSLKCENFDIVEEIFYKLGRQNKNLRIIEIPFTFKKRMFGQTKRNLVLFVITYLFTMIRLRASVALEDLSKKSR